MEFKYTLTEDTRERNFIIKIQPTGELEIDLGALQSYCNSKNASSINQPLRAIQSLDIALRYGILDRYSFPLLLITYLTEFKIH